MISIGTLTRRLATAAALIAAGGALAFLLLEGAKPAAAGSPSTVRYLYPDLRMMPATELHISPNSRLLEFGTTVANTGRGPIELVTGLVRKRCMGQPRGLDAFQAIYRDRNRNGRYDKEIDRAKDLVEVGCFLFHPLHDHWHYGLFSTYLLKRIAPNGRAGATVRGGSKISFCVIDVDHVFPNLPGSPNLEHYNFSQCSKFGKGDVAMGVSIGWGDTYGAGLQGQAIRIADLPADSYCFIMEANPQRVLDEIDLFSDAAPAVQYADNRHGVRLFINPETRTLRRLGRC